MNSFIVQWTHALVPLLLVPVVIGLFVCVALACIDIGVLLGERGLLRRAERPADIGIIERRAHRRIERADILTRTSPMLGLMATLISLGPGLMALSNGNLNLLAEAMLTAFDATVLGLAAGVVGFIIGRLRRRWYDEALLRWEQQA
ncbi:MAG: MotA/TolQ/ExbB proton channel family protein [Pseudomonadota bacterium]|nr:MotA/TolQ/ExbB proton channel family protein [Pseudomonadota bacterium]